MTGVCAPVNYFTDEQRALYAQLEKINSYRKAWQPAMGSPGGKSVPIGESNTDLLLSRMLATRLLELPVKEFIQQGISRSEKPVVEAARAFLELNQADEEKHDTALTNSVNSFANYDASQEEFVKAFLAEISKGTEHPFATILVLENSIFMVVLALLMQIGTPVTRTTARDISADERIHVNVGRTLCKTLGIRPTKRLDTLRREYIAWLFDGFSAVKGSKVVNVDSMMAASNNLLYKGIAPELEFTQSYSTPAFFEHRNTDLPYYQ